MGKEISECKDFLLRCQLIPFPTEVNGRVVKPLSTKPAEFNLAHITTSDCFFGQ